MPREQDVFVHEAGQVVGLPEIQCPAMERRLVYCPLLLSSVPASVLARHSHSACQIALFRLLGVHQADAFERWQLDRRAVPRSQLKRDLVNSDPNPGMRNF